MKTNGQQNEDECYHGKGSILKIIFSLIFPWLREEEETYDQSYKDDEEDLPAF